MPEVTMLRIVKKNTIKGLTKNFFMCYTFSIKNKLQNKVMEAKL